MRSDYVEKKKQEAAAGEKVLKWKPRFDRIAKCKYRISRRMICIAYPNDLNEQALCNQIAGRRGVSPEYVGRVEEILAEVEYAFVKDNITKEPLRNFSAAIKSLFMDCG